MNRRVKPRGFEKQKVRFSDLDVTFQKFILLQTGIANMACEVLAAFSPEKNGKEWRNYFAREASISLMNISKENFQELVDDAEKKLRDSYETP